MFLLHFLLNFLWLSSIQLRGIHCSTGLPPGLPIHKAHGGVKSSEPDSESPEGIRLEDFFWTGSGDGPPEYVKKVHTTNNGKEVIVKTETVVATVYVEGQNDVDAICLDCIRENHAIPANFSTSDRRYWLLTVVAGYFRPRDFPMLEEKLASLYRIAFTRQYSRHLGIPINSTDDGLYRKKRSAEKEVPTSTPQKDKDESSQSESALEEDDSNHDESKHLQNYDNIDAKRFAPTHQDVHVVIHNITLITEEDLQSAEGLGYPPDRPSRPLENQTELIYSVFVGGKPILATTAADDMKLVSQNEVSQVMGKIIFTKAEPYIREPQATPLVPASKNGRTDVLAVISHNPLIITITSLAVIILLILLIALLLMTRAKRRRSAEVKRLSSREGLLSERTTIERVERTVRPGDSSNKDAPRRGPGGVENLGFEHEQNTRKHGKDSPSINFPMPPISRPTSSTASTSDSSVYCPLNKPNLDLKSMLDRKAAHLFEKKKKKSIYSPYSTQREPTYATVGRGRDRKSKHKLKRKYIGENRVGSLEDDKTASSQVSVSSDSLSDSLKQSEEPYEYNEAYNPDVATNYHKNKVLLNKVFTDKHYSRDKSPTQAINREILKVHRGENSPGSGSIGSFLSMASVKSFPHSTLPEPLHRVLEPVSVHYYDHCDDHSQIAPLRKSKGTKTIIVDERDIAPTAGVHTIRNSTQSDDPDPGVIGPVVWEIHKKRLAIQSGSEGSPVHDPAISRNRYEGLLEGAIQMYSNSPEENPAGHTISGNEVPGIVRPKENRGKSAVVTGTSHRFTRSNSDVRPLTAGGPIKCHSNGSTQPPSPNGRAWGSGAPSPLVRPLSAGPFHRPEAPIVDVTRILATNSADKTQLSAAPLIEAIQNELKKFKRENSH